jgi:hypothetical protein
MLEKIFSQIRFRFFDYAGKPSESVETATEHIRRGLQWFKASLLPEGGAAAKYSMMSHLLTAGYPMTTANWVPLLIRIRQFYPEVYYSVLGNQEILTELVNWILRTQRRDGTFPASYGDFMNQPPRVFNNGMIIHGLLDYYNATNRGDILDACVSSADWLLRVQSADGSWRQFTFHQLSSNTYTAAALIRLAAITGNNKYRIAGEKNIAFALSLQSPNGYFKGNGFDSSPSAFTITIAYAIAGILEAGVLTGNDEWKKAAFNGLMPVLNLVNQNGFLVGEIDENFNSESSFTCLPGNSLLAISAYKLASLTHHSELKDKADLLTNHVKSKQMKSKIPAIEGGVPGSWPISGNYCSYEIPSWSVRYFTEAVMMQDATQG